MSGPLDPDKLFLRIEANGESLEQGLKQPSVRQIADIFDVSTSTITRARQFGWNVWQAERWALRYGLLPQQVWVEWDRLCDIECGVRAP